MQTELSRKHACIIGTGSYLPAQRLCNPELAAELGVTREWIERRTGILQRHVAAADEATSDLAAEAGQMALQDAGVCAADVDLIIVATGSGDVITPSTACRVQQQLKAVSAAAFDLNAACSGFLYGLSVGAAHLESSRSKTVLLIAAEIRTRFVNRQDSKTAVVYGDGAGAVVLSKDGPVQGCLVDIGVGADGRGWNSLSIPAGGSRLPASAETVAQGLHFLRWDSRDLIRSVTRGLVRVIAETLEKNGLTAGQIDLIIPHQMNLRIIESVAAKTGIDTDKFFVNVHRCGNTAAASIPIALDEALRAGRIRPGSRVLLAAFGAGFTWGAALIEWQRQG
jgi:3-oxoacyl-[acyl-carrier-protein] synthase III